MPGVHRNGDKRFCTGSTTVVGNSTVFVNNKLWAVEGDSCDHGDGALIAVYGPKNVYVQNKLVICAMGDAAGSDDKKHVRGQTDPKEHSTNTIVYGGAAGGG